MTNGGESEPKEARSLEQRLERALQRELAHQTPGETGRTIGPYQIDSFLGAGAFGIVYRAIDARNSQTVAIKVARPETLLNSTQAKQFVAEADIIAKIDHPNIVGFLEADTEGLVPYITTQYCDGPDLGRWLQDRLANERPLPGWKEVVQLMIDVTNAVDHVHQTGVAHRDLKPANVLLDRNRVEPLDGKSQPSAETSNELSQFIPRVSDFGLSKLSDAAVTDSRSSVILGTPAYLAPEQLLSPSSDDASHDHAVKSDVYGLGAILYELLTGRTPVVGRSYIEVLENVRHSEPAPIERIRSDDTIPKELALICKVCLQKNPTARYATAKQLAEDLERCLRSERVMGQAVSWRSRYHFWHTGQAWLTTAGRFAMASCLLIGCWMVLTPIGSFWFEAVEHQHALKGIRQIIQLLLTSTLPLGVAGWFCASGKRWAAWVGLALCVPSLIAATLGLIGRPIMFQELYRGHNLYLSYTVHLFILLCYLTQAALFLFALRQHRRS